MHAEELHGRLLNLERPIHASADIGSALTKTGAASSDFAWGPVFPVGAVYVTSSSGDDPAVLLGYGTWTLLGSVTL